MSTAQAPRSGMWNASAYQSSGIPYVTGSAVSGSGAEVRFKFPLVTRAVTVINQGAGPLRVHFTSLTAGNVAAGRHFISLPANKDSITLEHKMTEIWVSLSGAVGSDVEVVAELTSIPQDEYFLNLTGTGLTD